MGLDRNVGKNSSSGRSAQLAGAERSDTPETGDWGFAYAQPPATRTVANKDGNSQCYDQGLHFREASQFRQERIHVGREIRLLFCDSREECDGPNDRRPDKRVCGT